MCRPIVTAASRAFGTTVRTTLQPAIGLQTTAHTVGKQERRADPPLLISVRENSYWTIIAVTMPNMPASFSACESTWQWKAHTPNSLAVTSTSTRCPGATSTVSCV